MSLYSKFKTLWPVHLVIAYVFIVAGLLVNLIQFLTYLFIWPLSKKLYRKINVYLAYSLWSYLTAMAQYWSGMNVDLYMSKEDFHMFNNEHFVCVMNHKYDIDWVIGWIICQRIGLLGGSKILGKSSLKMVPIMGWCWLFTESVFIRRKWETDSKTLVKDMDKIIVDYPDNWFFNILMFCEGTRFTAKKHEASMKIAREKGLPELKHHLLPRTKGFQLMMKGANGRLPALYDLNVAFEPTAKPDLNTVISGIPLKGHMLVRRIPIEKIPVDDEAQCSEFIHKLYQEKDEIHDTFVRTGNFDACGVPRIPTQKNYYDLIISIGWLLIIGLPSLSYLVYLFFTGSLINKIIFVAVIAGIQIAVNLLFGITQSERGSEYGLKKTE